MTEQTDRIFFAKLADMVNRCERDGYSVFSSFFDERQCAEAEMWCRRNTGGLHYTFHGGFHEANRKMLAVYPDYCEDYIKDEFPIKCLTFTYRKEDRLNHRDFLGSFMGLMLKRDTIGDIVVSEGIAQTAVTEVAAKDILSSVSKIGRTGIKVSDSRDFELSLSDIQQFRDIGGTVASLRLDCITALAANISREKAVSFIRADRVDVNHFTVSSVSHELKEGDILSIRGFGRFILSAVNGLTKKSRIRIILKKYI
ncbi:MAG: RNA-binding protein [Ruminococcus sp.]|nr:RNA-binding protein [Ruminococcus sp.]